MNKEEIQRKLAAKVRGRDKILVEIIDVSNQIKTVDRSRIDWRAKVRHLKAVLESLEHQRKDHDREIKQLTRDLNKL